MEQRKRATGEEFDDDFRSAFRLIDVDGDGIISVQDLYQLMMGIGEMLTDDELSELLKGADADGDGEVSYKGNTSGGFFLPPYKTKKSCLPLHIIECSIIRQMVEHESEYAHLTITISTLTQVCGKHL